MRYLLLLSHVFIMFYSNAQELLCNVRVNSSQIQTSDRKIFQSLQTDIYEFVNNKKLDKNKYSK